MLSAKEREPLGIQEITYVAPSPSRQRARTLMAERTYLVLKRLMDIVLSALALVILSPLFLLIALAIVVDSPGPVIFRQKRVRGQQDPNEEHPERLVFDFFKFRSMYTNCDTQIHRDYVRAYMAGQHDQVNNGSASKPLFKMKHDPRVTRVGRFLRRTSLDELPQLWNVLKGDMSLVGPRPALPYEVEQYDAHQRQRLVPQAGLTGLWQVSGRTCLTFEDMVRLDIEYSQKRSLWLDLKILAKTLPAVLSGDGAW